MGRKHRMRSSRRAAPLEDTQIDHEIDLEDHSNGEGTESSNTQADNAAGDTAENPVVTRTRTDTESQAPLIEGAVSIADDATAGAVSFDSSTLREGQAGPESQNAGAEPSTTRQESGQEQEPRPSSSRHGLQNRSSRRSSHRSTKRASPHPRQPPETEIDILYQNERGGFLCGIPLFSSAALGNLDPPPWTNIFHKPSPTDIQTAQPPDPSWEWAWPQWRVNHDDATDADRDGWEYSFMFSRKFSWHGPKWWNSFVRRRAWIRRRVKKEKGVGYQTNDPHLLNPDYFPVARTSTSSRRPDTTTGSVLEGRPSTSQAPSCNIHEEDRAGETQRDEKKDIESVDVLMEALRHSRIDREKLESVENYIEHGTDDLLHLQAHMHEIMSLFMFQASRQLLLAHLMRIHDDAVKQLQQQQQQGGDEATPELQKSVENLAAAVKHADEEVRRLEYWSDVKEMALNGEAPMAVEGQEGWQGLDKSGGMGANREELPS